MCILLGHNQASSFSLDAAWRRGSLLTYEGDAPVCVVAPTGSGKTRDVVIPNILNHPGPVIAVDVKGELSTVTARARREMGHQVVILDPFEKTGLESGGFNPLDLLRLEGADREGDAEMMATLLCGDCPPNERFWYDSAHCLVAAMISHISQANCVEAGFNTLHCFLSSPELGDLLQSFVTRKLCGSEFVSREFSAFSSMSADRVRSSVQSVARTFVRSLGSDRVARSIETSTFSLQDVIDGASLDIFIVIPPDKLESHQGLLKLWIGTLLTAVMRRTRIPDSRTLFVLDEARQLGTFEPLLTSATLLRGYGLQLMTVWQDFSQLSSCYPRDWQTILNNSGAILGFGFGMHCAARDAGQFFGMPAQELLTLGAGQAILAERGEAARRVRRMNYLTDSMFEGMADPNPFFARKAG